VATSAELSADLRLPVITVAAVLRVLERSGWWVGGDWSG
jgi:hypothetical protein